MRRYLIFATTALGLIMYSIDGTAVAVALPNLIKDLNTNVLWAGWTISVFYIGIVTAMPLMGNLSDTFGRKRIYLISLVFFAGSSLACGLASSVQTLIAFRFLQGIGDACFLPTASGIVSDLFPEHRARVIGLFSSIYPIGSIIGPNLGGWIVSRFSWRYIFYINLPIGFVLIALISILLKESKVLARSHVDYAGAFFMSGAIFFLMFGLNLMGERFSYQSASFVVLFLSLSFAMGALFVRQEKKEANPVLDLTLLQSKPFLAANLLNIIMGAGLMGLFAFIPLYATSVYGLSTLMSGMILTPQFLAVIPASAVTSFLLKRWGYRWPMVIGLSITSIVIFLLGPGINIGRMMGIRLGVVEILSLLVLFAGIGMGIAYPAANNAAIELMPRKVATIVALRSMFRNVGAAIGVSIVTFILHLSASPGRGFTVTFIFFGLVIICSIPLVFLMPTGKKGWE
jgi:EmrB/QacA subfamily drug resistance transporter